MSTRQLEISALFRRTVRSGIPVVAFLMFATMAIVAIFQVAEARSSLDTLKNNVLGQSVTSNDSAMASSILARRLSEYLRGIDDAEEVRSRAAVLNTQLKLASLNIHGSSTNHMAGAKNTWIGTKEYIDQILDGDRDPRIIDYVFTDLDEIRVSSKQSADAWQTGVVTTNLQVLKGRLDTQRKLFSLFAPIGAFGAIVVIALTLRSRHRERLQAENQQLVKINGEKTQFITQVSHELKTPLTSVIAFTDLLIGSSDRELSPRQSKHLKIIRRNGEYLRLLVNDLIDVSQLETGNIVVDLEPISLGDIFTDLMISFGPIVERKNQVLTLVDIDSNIHVDGDHLRLLQVFSNLIGNATKYAEPDTNITVEATAHSTFVLVTVTDEGLGIPDVEKQRAFEMFYRGKSDQTTRQSGTGIGLAVSKRIIDAHNGTISIHDAEPIGTKIIVNLPLSRSAPSSDIGSHFAA